MNLHDAILSRRTIYDFDASQPVSPEVLSRALESARWGQNHKLTQPWRFVVVGPQGRQRLAKKLLALMLAKLDGQAAGVADARRVKAQEKADQLAALPALLVVAMQRTPGDLLREREDYAAVATAVQNLSLSLWADGVGMQWGTGEITRDPEAYAVCGFDPQREEIVGFLKVGVPATIPQGRREPLDTIVRHVP